MISIHTHCDLIQYAYTFQNDSFLLQLSQVKSMSDELLQTFLLQTNYLSNDMILFLYINRKEFTTKYILPLIQDRSDSVFDIFFSDNITEQQVEKLWIEFTTGAQQLNGLEIALLLYLRSKYECVDQALQILLKTDCFDRKAEVIRKLNQTKHTQVGQESPFEPQTTDYINEINVYQEQIYFSENTTSKTVPFTTFWYEFAQFLISNTPISSYTLIENISLGTQEQARLSICCFPFTPINLQINLDQQNFDIVISSQAEINYLQLNEQSQLLVKAEISSPEITEIQLIISLNSDIYTSSLESSKTHYLTIFKGQNSINIIEEILSFSSEFSNSCINIEVLCNNKTYKIDVQVNYPLQIIQNQISCDAQYYYLQHCSQSEFLVQIERFETDELFGNLLQNRQFAQRIHELLHSQNVQNRKIHYLISIGMHDAGLASLFLSKQIKPLLEIKRPFYFDSEIIIPQAQIQLNCDNTHINFLENSLSKIDEKLCILLLGKQMLSSLEEPEKVTLAQIFIKMGRYDLANNLVEQSSLLVGQLLKLYIQSSQIDNSYQISQFLIENEQFLRPENVNILKNLIKNCKSNDEFSVKRSGNKVIFNQTPVILKFYNNSWNGDSNLKLIPQKQINCNELEYELQSGNYTLIVQKDFETVQLAVNNTKIDFEIDKINKILTINNEQVCYVRFLYYGTFAQDSFTDYNGNVLIPENCDEFVILRENGEFIKSTL
ncbi:hypothetical protein SS50377_25245 [Spironucleus salmonicida]|uniref:Uncharacterized protein n=1 Tax=Spironucleus salmonicida TaxID=348837 RepID=V6LMD0_9EUKA|nr:hypothetical protein SS50377_25245 [Spironucleus salmonicida]|eukprot:EST41874.1 Hypothetical protein SS50377_18710 [Spironucleus salmonicida]